MRNHKHKNVKIRLIPAFAAFGLSFQAGAVCLNTVIGNGKFEMPAPSCSGFDNEQAEKLAISDAERQCGAGDGLGWVKRQSPFSYTHSCDGSAGTETSMTSASAAFGCCFPW